MEQEQITLQSPEQETGLAEQPASDVVRVDVVDLATVLAYRKWFIVKAALIAAVLTAIVALLIPNSYTGTVQLLPPEQNQSFNSLLSENFGSLSQLAAGNILTDPNQMYVSMIQSRTVADRLIAKFKLQERYSTKTLIETRDALRDHTSVTSGDDRIIHLEFDDHDPQFAAAVANGYVDELLSVTEEIAAEDGKRRSAFYEKELQEVRGRLEAAELAFRQTQEKTGVLKLDDQAKAMVDAVVELKARIVAAEIELRSLGTFATSNNPTYIRKRAELAAMRAQLADVERKSNREGDLLVATAKLPAAGLEYLRRYRDVEYYNALYGTFAKLHEAAVLDSKLNYLTVRVLDYAVTPDKKSRPKRGLMVMLAFLAGGSLAAAWVLGQGLYKKLVSDPHRAAQLERLEIALVGNSRVGLWTAPFRRIGKRWQGK